VHYKKVIIASILIQWRLHLCVRVRDDMKDVSLMYCSPLLSTGQQDEEVQNIHEMVKSIPWHHTLGLLTELSY